MLNTAGVGDIGTDLPSDGDVAEMIVLPSAMASNRRAKFIVRKSLVLFDRILR
jgi:hypothetical protein